ncbi:MAG TPA: hypothetical protein VKF39_06435 [Nitrososphaerales archaeon]|nr:hypothetical protein [Nitrososphaerales archaeon]
MNTKKLFGLVVEAGSAALSIYGFVSAVYWYWVFLQSAPVQSISSNALVLQGVPLSHIIESLLTIALGGFIHTMHRLWPEILELFERVGRGVESEAKRV